MEELDGKIEELHSQMDLQRTAALKEMEKNEERITDKHHQKYVLT